jgi:16S rRNA pseudouridine516 synthase
MKNNIGNRKQCISFIKKGCVSVNREIIYDIKYKVKEQDIVMYNQQILKSQPFLYYMFNKPAGYVSANKDKNYPCVLDFFDEKDLVIIGRLDIDTTGLMILSNNKSLVKKLLLPKNHISKKYYVETLYPLKYENINDFYNGIMIDQNVLCKSADLEIIDSHHCYITLFEGKYHQIKKMFLSINNQVVSLKRVMMKNIVLDHTLNEGEYRLLSKEEIEELIND